jgi:2-dehydro-3-deoxyglucarate aldolase/4-hydroxy-2-oxoheptanedioate aldolase
MRQNHAKDKLCQQQTVIGCALQHFRSSEVARALAASGFDYLFIDCEHTGFNLETVQDMIAASLQAGITPLVRVGELLYSLISRVLDVGAQGIILPRVASGRELEQAISWIRFPPAGTRGFGIMAPVLDYKQHSFQEIIEHLNANTLVVVQFETREAIERCEELLSVPGFDVALVGPSDLSVSLGVPGQFDHPVLVRAVMRLIEACEARRIAPGIQCRNPAQAMPWLERGMRVIGVGSELTLLLEKARETIISMRSVGQVATAAPTRV